MVISGITSTRSNQIASIYPVPERTSTQAALGARPGTQRDTVQLSSQARVKSLQGQGYSINAIVTQTGLDVKTVQQYLNAPEASSNDAKSGAVSQPEHNGTAETGSVKENGYPPSRIAGGMGLAAETVDQYPGNTEPVTSAPQQSKKLYQEPELTGAAQARSLKSSGYSVAMIASQMGVSVEVIKDYLGIA